jgi:hypothetical protein
VKRLSLEKNVDREYLLKNYFYNPDSGNLYHIKGFFKKRLIPLKSLNSHGYFTIKILGKTYQSHQVAFYMIHGFLPRLPYTIDHINGNRKDNRLRNLRIANRTLQNINRKTKRGAHFNKEKGKWYSQIQMNNKKYYLGAFLTKNEAYMAYDHALRFFKMPKDCFNKLKK